MNILITGGCGYVGTLLVKELSCENHTLKVVDTVWFGNYLKKNKNIKLVQKDIRQLTLNDFKGIDVVIHLANIANDPGVELNPLLSWDVNVLSSYKLINLSIKAKVKQFIYASSGSVYGIKKEKKVTEDLDLVPISTYNKTKLIAERIFMSYKDKIKIHCIRPATVCGYSPKMRLDVSVNMLTYQALSKNLITVFGGKQIRPNIHILDLVNVYKHFLDNYHLDSGFYNAGFENISLLNIAKKISKNIKCKIKIEGSSDPRSYRLSSEKLLGTGFKQLFDVNYAIKEIMSYYDKGLLTNNINFNTVKKMKSLKLNETII